ncbi:MAG: hypothetical protein QG658_487 [Patescibacteria group bacterium]|nr:hypothetical protein [Patescibacteria group bacterium]
MNKKFSNTLLYILASGFLLWHLLPLFSVGKAVAPSNKTNAEIAMNTMCYGGDLTVPTFGNPLTDPLTVDLNTRPELVATSKSLTSVDLGPYPNSGNTNGEEGWQADSYGNNSSTFDVKDNSILAIEMKNFVDGDAKWRTPQIPVKPGESLRFASEYRSNVASTSNVTFILQDGTEKYVTLSRLSATDSWKQQSTEVIVPKNVVALRFSVILDQNGWLQTKDYTVDRYITPGFSRGIVSFTFDDGWESIYKQGLPLFEQYGIKTTQFVVADYDVNEAYMSPDQIRAMQKLGHDIGSHSFSHADHEVLQDKDLAREVAGSRTVLNQKYGGTNNFAAPFGRYNQDVNDAVKQCYQSHRTTDSGFNTPGYDRYTVRVQNVEVDTKPEQIREWAEFARDNNLWLVLVYHQVEDGGAYSVDTAALESHLKAVKDTGVHTATYEEALIETYPQGR